MTAPLTDEQLALVMAVHQPDHYCAVSDRNRISLAWYVAPHQGRPCLPYRLAAEVRRQREVIDKVRALARGHELRCLSELDLGCDCRRGDIRRALGEA